jgi:hypothetical protein
VRLSLLCLPSSQLPPGRKTVDGYNIYKEDELGISATGGGDHLIHPPRSVLNLLVQTPLYVRLIANAVRLPCCPTFSSSFPPHTGF